MWSGQTVAVLASGPSMSQAVADAVRATPVPTIVVNSTFRLASWASMLYAADAEWWTHPTSRDALEFAGLRVSVAAVGGVNRLQVSGLTGFDSDPDCVRTGGNSGYQAVHVAAQAGAARILLCGFDMGGGHWHAQHPSPLRTTNPETFEVWIRRFETLAEALAQRGVEVLNCTPKSALRCVRYMDLERALAARTEPAAA